MKGRTCIAVCFALIALLSTPVSGLSKAVVSSKVAAKHRKTKKALPSNPSATEKYTVRRGDTLFGIAREFNTSPRAIKSASGMKKNRIKVGQILRIPVTKSAAAAKKDLAPQVLPLSLLSVEAVKPSVPEADAKTDDAAEDSPTRYRLVEAGFKLIGVKYRFGGTGKAGFDCSGLVKNLFSKFNIELPRSSREQFRQGEKINRSDLKPGDLVFFSSGGTEPTHVGIYVGNDKFLHAARKAKQVIVSDLNKIWYTMRYLGARRVIDLWSEDQPENSEE